MIADAEQRAAAIDISRSCIVQAPAGSGKTELLIQRLLALLGQVDRPQQILAITFTNKAAAEMRHRLLGALGNAAHAPEPETAHEALTWRLARRALAKQGDSLLKNPAQLAIQTIDSFNASLVRKMPWMSRFGSLPEMADDADSLYLQTVEKVLNGLESGAPGHQQLTVLLRHLDNQVPLVQRLLVDLLRRRDQWLRYLRADVETSHHQLQQALDALYEQKLDRLQRLLPSAQKDALLDCLRFAAGNLPDSPLGRFCQAGALPGFAAANLKEWIAIGNFLLTAAGELRKTVTKNNGFPAGKEHQAAKERMLELLRELSGQDQFIRALQQVRGLPAGGYSVEQWRVLEAVIQLLPVLLVDLWQVFKNKGQADFSEIALKANQALGRADDPSDLLLRIDQDLQHILVDEFQDTSRLQYQLLSTLTSGWMPGDGRTLFLVGDPMQSIYLFREAEVGLFLETFKGSFGDLMMPLQPLRLSCNFRSQQGVVDWNNTSFKAIFPAQTEVVTGAVPMAEAVAVKPALPGAACTIHPLVGRNDLAEAEKVIELIQQAQAADPEQSIAVLVRSRSHLQQILPLLRRLRMPYQARDIEVLGARPAALDLVHLTKALLHRGDRLSWLAVLRAPWCGLTLHDLHTLVADSRSATLPTLLADPERRQRLSTDGRARLARVWPLLEQAHNARGRLPLRQLVEKCWLGIGGAACYDADGIADAQLVFDLLENLDEGGDVSDFALLEQGLKSIFSAPEVTDCKLQIMTIHKAKGLEFDTVILPGLGRSPQRGSKPLLRWLEHPELGLLLAPVAAYGEQENDPLYQLIAEFELERENLETARLLYVATTRAIRHLHLLGHVNENRSTGVLTPAKGTLLETLWPVAEAYFAGCEAPPEAVVESFLPPLLQRLPGNWTFPAMETVNLALTATAGTASEEAKESGDRAFSGWESPKQRHIGTLVHMYLEQLARQGSIVWDGVEPAQRTRQIALMLRGLGVGAGDLDDSVARVCRAVEAALGSERGRWVLASHQEHACEQPLSGLVDGKLVHAIIDRTFIADGQRWIIDYKTSVPRTGESVSAFVQREAERYRAQLEIYVKLYAAHHEQCPIRAALFFPLAEAWYEFSE